MTVLAQSGRTEIAYRRVTVHHPSPMEVFDSLIGQAARLVSRGLASPEVPSTLLALLVSGCSPLTVVEAVDDRERHIATITVLQPCRGNGSTIVCVDYIDTETRAAVQACYRVWGRPGNGG